ncbi:hypothetical protein BHE74_00013083 [Ensete ventricosum]|nr:hypothetical protein BHE74_00013083 [Ensete ventricosum]
MEDLRSTQHRLDDGVLKLARDTEALQTKLQSVGAKAIVEYKMFQGFELGIERIGHITYEFRYRPVLEIFRAKYPDLSLCSALAMATSIMVMVGLWSLVTPGGHPPCARAEASFAASTCELSVLGILKMAKYLKVSTRRCTSVRVVTSRGGPADDDIDLFLIGPFGEAKARMVSLCNSRGGALGRATGLGHWGVVGLRDVSPEQGVLTALLDSFIAGALIVALAEGYGE